jgi:D-alanyl-D-alanine carboxypeptidase/D-alanyl-D-alanine-endopeptidase (penicillin-binding protein 4)
MRHLLALLLPLAAVPLGAQSNFQRAVDALAADPAFRHGTLSVCVVEVESGKVLASYEAMRGVAPASNLKVLSTGSALALLGPGYRFRTELQYDGRLEADGTLAGNLYLKGYGDPTLGSPFMEGEALALAPLIERLRLAVQQAGIRRIEGQIIADASLFGSEGCIRTWQWEDLGNYYAAGAWSLNLHENLHFLHLQQRSQVGATPPVAAIEPEVPGLSFTNELRSAAKGTGDNAYIFGGPYQFNRYIRGTIPVGQGRFTIKGSIPDPPLLAAQYLQQSLASIGITARGLSTLLNPPPNPPARKTLYTHYSPALPSIVERANMESVNLFCEVLVKAIGLEKKGEGTTDAGLDIIRHHWERRGLDWAGCQLADGSGLSDANVATSTFLAQFLRLMAKEEAAVFQPFYASLPEAGRSGSLKNRLKGTAAEGRLRAKSGTLERARAYSGYATARNGQLLAFSIIANNYEGSGGVIRQKLEGLMLELCR